MSTPLNTLPISQELAASTTYSVGVASSSQIVRIGVEGIVHCTPVKIARFEPVLPMGGEILWPGSEQDFYGPFFIRTPAGLPAYFWCEQRSGPTAKVVDSRGQLRAQSGFKASYRDLVPGVWLNFLSNVSGQNGVKVRVSGGTAYIGTHINPSIPPDQADPNIVGVPVPIYPGDPWLEIPGNPFLYAYAYDPGVRLWFAKEENSWAF